MTWLLGGRFEQISSAICSMIGDITGIICDGAKTSCAMKVSSSASAAVKAALMALDGMRVTGNEGIVADDVDTSIRNMSALANGAMTPYRCTDSRYYGSQVIIWFSMSKERLLALFVFQQLITENRAPGVRADIRSIKSNRILVY